jgi:hypothetical protein
MSQNGKRRRWTAAEKLRIVRRVWMARSPSASCVAVIGSTPRSTTAGRTGF